MTVRPRRLALAVAAAALAVSVSGCAYFNDTQTHEFYQAADGTNANPTGVGVRNAVLVVDAKGNGRLYTTVTNTDQQARTVQLEGTFDGSTVFSASVSVPAGGVTPVGMPGQQAITASSVAAKPGSIMQLSVTAPGQKATTISMPVMDDSLGYYPAASDGGQG